MDSWGTFGRLCLWRICLVREGDILVRPGHTRWIATTWLYFATRRTGMVTLLPPNSLGESQNHAGYATLTCAPLCLIEDGARNRVQGRPQGGTVDLGSEPFLHLPKAATLSRMSPYLFMRPSRAFWGRGLKRRRRAPRHPRR
jgi:hypothetical protein